MTHPLIAEYQRLYGVAHPSNGRRLPTALSFAGVLSREEQEARIANSGMWTPHQQHEPVADAVAGARSYASKIGLPDPHEVDYSKVMTSPDNVRQLGRAYDKLPEFDTKATPHFDAMRREIGQQYDHLTNTMGIKAHFVDHDPYKSAAEMIGDVRDNKRIKVLRTAVTGSHPYFSDDDNDKFRAVHDFFGHAATGREFDAHGEDAAALAHSKMFTSHALPAMASETRGQNGSLNLNGEFAPQKIAVLPRHLWTPTQRSDFGRGASKQPRRAMNVPLPFEAFLRKQAHDSGDGQTIYHCFAGETQYWTQDGLKTLADTVGTVQKVLSNTGTGGRWVDAEIVDFGEQSLMKVTLRRNKRTKVVYATPEHRWLVRARHAESRSDSRIVLTQDLRPDHRLSFLLPRSRVATSMPSQFGIAHGVVYGDGTKAALGSTVNLWGEKDAQLLRYFAQSPQSVVKTVQGVLGVHVTGMPSFFKDRPALTESVAYLYGFLAGWFAADGSVSSQGQAILTSASRSDLEFAQTLAMGLGIGAFDIVERIRLGYGEEPSALYSLQFIGSTLRPEFFLVKEHRERYGAVQERGNAERIGWTVESVEASDRFETVYCAVVPEHENFVLDGLINTMNCPFCGSGQVIARSDRTIECEFCFAGETEFVTVEGIRTLKETVGTIQRVLVSQAAIGSKDFSEFGGRWVDAEIRSFGVQPLMKVTLRRAGDEKVIHATPEHRWLVTPMTNKGYRSGRRNVVLTKDLATGARLAPLFAQDRLHQGPRHTVPSPFGIAHGFTFGDGSTDGRGGSTVTMWGDKDLALLPLFSASEMTHCENGNGTRGITVRHLPAFFKQRPSLNESLPYLYGWLAGYFAADGSVSEQGCAQLYCADPSELDFVRAVATVLGIGTLGVRTYERQGYGDPSDLSRITFIGSTLTEDFFVIPEHRQRFLSKVERRTASVRKTEEHTAWKVVSVEETDRVEEVYCAVVPGWENFTLAENINVMNCHTAFTVQVQPEYSAFPQTIDGQPVQVPGMPGQTEEPMPPGMDQADPDAEQPPVDPNADPDAQDAPDDDQDDDDEKKPNPFTSSLRTQAGVQLSIDDYLARLALKHTDNREETIELVKAQRKS